MLEPFHARDGRVDVPAGVEGGKVHVPLGVYGVIELPGGYRLRMEGREGWLVSLCCVEGVRSKNIRTATAIAREWILASASATLELMNPPYD